MKNDFLPNDPLLSDQWHLINSGQVGIVGNDVNVLPAWQSVTGKGVTIGIIDSGLQHTHPDISSNYRPDLSYDFQENDTDPSPDIIGHGTAVAGVAAASGNNGIGVTGVAPEASLAGLKIGFGDDAQAKALSHKNQDIDIYNISGSPQGDIGSNLEAPGELTQAALSNGVTEGRGGLGSIYVWAAGNGQQIINDNVNYDGYANSRYTIAVAAIDANGKQAPYSEPGSPILVTTYSSGDQGEITTTDLQGNEGFSTGDYNDNFGGTSASAPLASGVIALMLEANPNLTWRDVQHILVNTSTQNDSTDGDWTENGAGHLVNHKYGFGSIDASAAVNLAKNWHSVAPETSIVTDTVKVGDGIPDNNPLGLTSAFSIDRDIKVESVELTFDALHPLRGDLEITLVSPDGTESVLAEQRNDAYDDYENWTFSSVRHWGESSLGDWTVKVVDKTGNEITGVWSSAQLNLYGTENTDTSNFQSISGTAEDNTLTGTNEDNLIFGREGNDLLTGNSGDDLIQGGDGNDTLGGDAGQNELLGETGDDFLFGGDERDTLRGGSGQDNLVGNGGNDLLTGGLGGDILTGGAGSDRFIYSSAEEGGDTIKDFNVQQDLIDVHKIFDPLRINEFSTSAGFFFSHITFEQVGPNTEVKFSPNGNLINPEESTTLATLENISASELSQSNLII